MSEKNVKDISVRELAAIADINRGTFYIHYMTFMTCSVSWRRRWPRA